MPIDTKYTRLEVLFDDAWKGKQNNKCLWWQGEWWSWKKLNDLALDCEEKLKNSGFEAGQRIVLLLPNSPMIFALSIAAWRLGGAVAPLNMRTGLVNMFDTIRKIDPHSIIITETAYDKAEGASKTIGVPLVSAKPDAPLPQWIGRKGKKESSDYAIFFSTSGTSGNPKAIGTRHSNLLDNGDAIYDRLPELCSYDSVFLNVLPNFHTFGNNVAGLLPLMHAVPQAIVPNFVPVDNTIRAIKESGVNVIIAVPTVIAFLVGALSKRDECLDGIKFIISGGDKLNVSLDERCQKYLGCGILEGYGLTECSPVVSLGYGYKKRKLGTVGPALSSFEIRVTDREHNIIDLHEEGILWVKGLSVASGYYHDPENTAARFDGDWFNTGDVVRIDEDGYIKIVDRATDLIIVSGFNVYPQEVEAVLMEHPFVKEAVCVSEKNKVAGELVKAFIILKEGDEDKVTEKDLINYCRERLAHYKVPRKIGFLKEYPLSQTGKVLRSELRKTKITRKK